MFLDEFNRYMCFRVYTFLKKFYISFHGCFGIKIGEIAVGWTEMCRTGNIKVRKLHLIQKAIKY